MFRLQARPGLRLGALPFVQMWSIRCTATAHRVPTTLGRRGWRAGVGEKDDPATHLHAADVAPETSRQLMLSRSP
jgi:hypothetical protein